MKLCDHIHVNASASSIWKVLSDPNFMEMWNPKCVRCHVGNGPFVAGFTYEATFRLSKSAERKAECTIEEYQPDRLLTTKYSGSAFKRGGYVRETYHLIPKQSGTRIEQVIDFTYSEISIIIQLIMKIISTVGHPAGKGPLDGIKELAEHEKNQQADSVGSR